MDIIEFLKRTDHRNLKYNINYLVKQKLKEYDNNLNKRRERLRKLLDSEDLRYKEELNLLQKACDKDKEAKRLEWIGLMRLDRERNEEALLKIKQQQRKFENSEEVKHMRSREMLLDAKQAQLYQIEEKKILSEQQAKIEQFWLDTMQIFNKEKEYQEIKEQKLRKCIAHVGQEKNLKQDAEIKAKTQNEAEALRQEFNEDNIRAWNIDKEFKKEEEFYEWRKKVHYKDVLERQIYHNALNNAIQRQVERENENLQRQQNQQAILKDIDNKGIEMVKNRAFQKEYLEHSLKEKQSLCEVEKEFHGMLIGTGCILEQKEKRPYCKNSR